MRFFSEVKDFDWALDRFLAIDYVHRHGLVALGGDPERMLGHCLYFETTPGRAEVALEVADGMQGKGLGTSLIACLAQAAAANGISVFEAEVMPENHRMIKVFRDLGYPLRTISLSGAIRIEFPTSLDEGARARFDERDHSTGVAAIRRFLEPASIAVIGASRQRDTIGGQVFHNLLESGFAGPVYPISPHPFVQSVAAYPSLSALPGKVDLAIVVVPAEAVTSVALDCAAGGVTALVVISAGFAEIGPEGAARQAELDRICHSAGMRLIGPNCMGILNTDPRHHFNATFAPAFPPPGRMGFMSQSGALGLAVIDRARSLGLGLSSFVSVGNKADISGNDLLEYWEDDVATDLILLYLESFGNPRRFSRIARRISRRKPILAVKSGRSAAGARGASSHTGALLAASDATVDALFEQAGVIRADTLAEVFDIASLLGSQPAPEGDRVAILTNAGGLGILCADACVAAGLEVPGLEPATRDRLAEFLPREAATANPVDMIASASGADYERALRVLAEAGEVDAVIVIFIPPLVTPLDDVAAAIRAAAPALAGRKPLLAVFTASAEVPRLGHGPGRVPTFSFPEEAARALGRAAQWRRLRSRPVAAPFRCDSRVDEAKAVIAEALGETPAGNWLSAERVAHLLDCYGISQLRWEPAATPAAVGLAARRLATPVAIKGVAAGLVHKSEAGAVALGLASPGQAVSAARDMTRRMAGLGSPPTGFIVQEMAPAGFELIVGVVQDPTFGPVVAAGAGGTAVELMKDVSFRLAPLTAPDADAMLAQLKSFPLLTGHRGSVPVDLAALRDLILRTGQLADEQPGIVEMDLNPVLAGPTGAVVVDARIRIGPPRPAAPEGFRSRR